MDRSKCVPSCLLNISVGTMLEQSLAQSFMKIKGYTQTLIYILIDTLNCVLYFVINEKH